MEALLDAEADVSGKMKFVFRHALHQRAASIGCPELVEVVLNAKADPNKETYHRTST